MHVNASLLAICAMLAQNPTNKYDEPIVYASRVLNKVEQKYPTIDRKALTMVHVLHKFKHFLLGNEFVFYVDHMVLVYLVNKPHVSRRITRWLLLFLEYQFTIICKLGTTHLVANALSILLNSLKPLGVPTQTIDASLFSIEPMWMQEVKS